MKPYKVTAYRHYGCAKIRAKERHFRYYWQANIWNWILYHVVGYEVCNTWVMDGANVKPREVKWV
jgi:hypothetical protein